MEGKRVIIIDKNHPWFGETGEMTGEHVKATDQLIIKLDNNQSAAVYLRQLRILED